MAQVDCGIPFSHSLFCVCCRCGSVFSESLADLKSILAICVLHLWFSRFANLSLSPVFCLVSSVSCLLSRFFPKITPLFLGPSIFLSHPLSRTCECASARCLSLSHMHVGLSLTHMHVGLSLSHMHVGLSLSHMHVGLSLSHMHVGLSLSHMHVGARYELVLTLSCNRSPTPHTNSSHQLLTHRLAFELTFSLAIAVSCRPLATPCLGNSNMFKGLAI